MKRKNQILAGWVALALALVCVALLVFVPRLNELWVSIGGAFFAVAALYNFAPVTMSDFFEQAGRTAEEIRDGGE